MINAHIPFELITCPNMSSDDLEPFKVIVMPDTEMMSDAEAAFFTQFVTNGGTLIITGPKPSAYDELGTNRTELGM
jgi:hypothetical protein